LEHVRYFVFFSKLHKIILLFACTGVITTLLPGRLMKPIREEIIED